MKRILFLVGGLLVGMSRAEVAYTLAVVDEFEGTILNETLWSRIGPGEADWNRNMSLRADLVEVKDGQVHLYGKRNEDLSADPRRVLTGGIKTEGKFALTYGKVEVRCKLEGQRGAWPAIWMLPDKADRKWPEDGEIDILERLNFDTIVYQTVHSGWTRHSPKTPLYSCQAPVHPDEWNVYGLEWTPEELTWTINGVPTHRYPRVEGCPGQYPWTEPFYLLIDMQLGGNWVGEVDESTLPTVMQIDWVKFYAASEDGKRLTTFRVHGEPKEEPFFPVLKK